MIKALLGAFATGADRPLLQDRTKVDALYRSARIQVMVAITGGYALSYTCRLAISVVKKPLIDQGIFSPVQLGLIGSALFYSYAFSKLTNGFLGDHANIKRFGAFGLLASALVCMGMGVSTSLGLSMLLWGLNGWFQGFGAPTAVVGLANWFSNHERGRYYGIWNTSHALGEGFTFIATGALVTALGWRAGFVGPGVLCIGGAIAMYLLLKDRPRTYGLPAVADWRRDRDQPADVAEAEAHVRPGVFLMQLAILKQPAMWALALSSAAMYVTRYGINSWGLLWLQETHGMNALQAGTMLGIDTFAGILGCIAFGYISDLMFGARRPPVNLIYGLVELLGLGLIFWGPNNWWVLATGFACFGFGINGLITSIGGLFGIDICPKRVAGAALGFVGVFSYLGAAIQDNISGFLIQSHMTTVAGVRHYDFQPVVLFWVGASVVSLVLATSLWRARMKD
jgi:OPA family sugar phosphate sensor protein UhpC-like MFS transporter